MVLFVNEVSHWTMSDMNFTRLCMLGAFSSLGPSCEVHTLPVLKCRSGSTLTVSTIRSGGVMGLMYWN